MTLSLPLDVEPEGSRLAEAFEAFHAANPAVYDELVAIARDLRARGYERFGIATVYEVCRWRSMVRVTEPRSGRTPASAFKLNNNHRAYYARLIQRQEPDLAGVFDTRKLGVPHHVAP